MSKDEDICAGGRQNADTGKPQPVKKLYKIVDNKNK